MSVMAFHYRYYINSQFPEFGGHVFDWGLIGVDLFFILSGFVITLSILKVGVGIPTAKEFIIKRANRLLPTYFILLVVNFIFGGAMATFHYPEKVANLISALTLSVNYANHGPFYVDDNGMYGVRWTLNYEFLFYLIVSACLLVRPKFTAMACFSLLLLIVIPMSFKHTLTSSTEGYGFKYAYINLMTNPIIWEFFMGVAIGLMYKKFGNLSIKYRITLLIFSVIVVVLHIWENTNVGHGITHSGVPLALLLSGVAFNSDWLDKVTPRWMSFIGDISFSLYLLHIVTMRVVSKNIPIQGAYLFAASFLFSIFFAWLSYKYIESIRFKKSKLDTVQP